MLVKFIRLVRGYVDFEARGKFPERFLNITARQGINLWNTHPVPSGLTGSMNISDYRSIRKTARKVSVHLKITEKHGVPFFFNKYKSRIGIPAGAVTGLVLALVLSNFIWSISISGVETVSESYIRDVLAEYGVCVGAYRDSINVQSAQRNTMLKIDEIGWMSVNITGSIACVEIKEKVQKPEMDESSSPCNLKAKCDGVITDLKVKEGETKVLKGSGVAKGDLLVSGVIESEKDSVDIIRYVKAQGEVMADVYCEKEFYIPKNFNYRNLTGGKTEYSELNFLHLSIPVSLSFRYFEDYAATYSKENIVLNGVVLPIAVTVRTDSGLCTDRAALSSENAERYFTNEALLYEIFSKGTGRVKSRDFSIKQKDGDYYCEISYIFNENIAQSAEFSVTE